MVVLIVDSDQRDVTALAAFFREEGHLPVVTDTVKSGISLFRKESPGLVLVEMNGVATPVLEFLDLAFGCETVPPVIVTSKRPRLEDAVEAMKRGAHDFWVKPVNLERLAKTIELLGSRNTRPKPDSSASDRAIISEDASMLRMKAMARRVAASSATVFIQGESGTGKELFARYIHDNSGRKEKPFVAVNCAALPETLLESELFGHEKGAFTGAIKSKEGKFELAHTGTLLLDEVTEIPLHLQAKLLRVLQESEVDRIGGRRPVLVDVRVVATTNLGMEEILREGRFRKDLYYRLNVIPLKIPSLRDRPSDVTLLSRHFVDKYSVLHGTGPLQLSPEALRRLGEYHWPGNVRELQNVIQRAVLLCTTREVTSEQLFFDEESGGESGGTMDLMPLSEMEKRMIHKALESVEGNRTRAAEILGISVRTLRNKLSEYRQELDE